MARTFDYVLVTLIGIGLVLVLVKPMVERTAQSIIESANRIQEAVD